MNMPWTNYSEYVKCITVVYIPYGGESALFSASLVHVEQLGS